MTKKINKFSRRKFFPAFAGLLLTPFIDVKANNEIKKPEYKTFLKKDGTSVKINVTSLKNAKIVKQKVSNKSLLKWLRK